MARRDPAGMRLLTRRGLDWTGRYPSIAAAVGALPCRKRRIGVLVPLAANDTEGQVRNAAVGVEVSPVERGLLIRV